MMDEIWLVGIINIWYQYTVKIIQYIIRVLNEVCCVDRVEIQIEIENGRCTANTDSIV